MAKEYDVLAIDELTRPDDLRGVKTVFRYTARTRGGTRFTVELDDPDPTSEKVAPVLAAKAIALDKILAL